MKNPSNYPPLKERLSSDLFLFLAALIWGGGFVAQRLASAQLGFNGFNGVRFLIAGLVLLPFVIKRFKNPGKNILWVLLAGFILYAASSLQQAGVETTTAGSAGFITGIYVVIVPILMALFWKHPSSSATWVAAVAAIGGTYLLSTGGKQLDPNAGDTLVFIGAFVWALHVIVVGLAVRKMDVFAFSAGQFLVCSLLHLVTSLFVEPLTLETVKSSVWALAYAGFFSAALGFTFQAIGQRKAPPADAALILSLEAVFGAIAGVLLLHEKMNWVQIVGCVVIMAAILFAQLAAMKLDKQKESQIIKMRIS